LDIIDKTFQLPYYDYDVNHDYAVVFVGLNKRAVDLLGEKAWDKIKEWLTDYNPEDEEGNFVNTLEFIPNEDVSKICDDWA
jgi:hypothetical protein